MRKYVKSVSFMRESLQNDDDMEIEISENKCRDKDIQSIPPFLVALIKKMAVIK